MRLIIRRTFFVLAFAFAGLSVFAQRDYKTPKHALGLEFNATYSVLSAYRSNDYSNKSQPIYSTTGGTSIILPYQFSSDEYIAGFQTGVGFHMWGISRRDDQWRYYTIGVPVVLQLKVSKPFWLEMGFQVNALVDENMSKDKEDADFPTFEGQGLLGFRYHIYKTWSFKGRAHIGLTPAVTRSNNAYRMFAFELGMAYLFPLKK